MQLTKLITLSALATIATASPIANAFPWADANPYSQAAAQAYADAYAEAQAIGHPDPDAYALSASADDCASISCHVACGSMIVASQACSLNTNDTYQAPYKDGCLCGSDSTQFLENYDTCLECGWTLWKYYRPYLISALQACGKETEPTGTLRCSTILTDEYTKDANINVSMFTGV